MEVEEGEKKEKEKDMLGQKTPGRMKDEEQWNQKQKWEQ